MHDTVVGCLDQPDVDEWIGSLLDAAFLRSKGVWTPGAGVASLRG